LCGDADHDREKYPSGDLAEIAASIVDIVSVRQITLWPPPPHMLAEKQLMREFDN